MALNTFSQCIIEAAYCIETKFYVGKEKKMQVAGLTMNVLSQDETFENCFTNIGNLSVLMIVSHTVNPEENTKTC